MDLFIVYLLFIYSLFIIYYYVILRGGFRDLELLLEVLEVLEVILRGSSCRS